MNGIEIASNSTAGRFFNYATSTTVINGPFTFTPNNITSGLAPYGGIQYNRFGSGENGNNPFDGALDDTRLWNIAKSDIEIRNSMNAPLAGNEANLVYLL